MKRSGESAAPDPVEVAESATDSVYREVFRTSPSPVVILDDEGRIQDWNPVCERLSGFTLDEVRGRPIWEVLLPPHQWAERSEVHAALMRSQGPLGRVGHWHTKSGKILKLLFKDWPFQVQGRIWIIQTAIDRTETLRAKGALRQVSVRDREIFDQLPALISVRDDKGRFALVNHRFRALYQLGGLVMEGLSPEDVMPPEHVQRIRQLDQLVAQTRRPQSCTLEVENSGARIELAATVFPLHGRDGTLNGLCMLAVDVTEQHRVELALAERTRDVVDLSSKLVTAYEDERRTLARNLHDGLNQEVAALAVELGMLAQGLPEDRTQVCGQLESLAGRCRSISEEVRRLSHELHPASLEAFGLRDALHSFALETARVHRRRIVFSAPQAVPPLPLFTATCLYRIAQEAVGNAIKYSGAEEIHLEIRAAHDRIRLVVTDDGSGFDAAGVAMQGIGMVTMQERARLAKGELTVQSRAGAGTRIQVEVTMEGESQHDPQAEGAHR